MDLQHDDNHIKHEYGADVWTPLTNTPITISLNDLPPKLMFIPLSQIQLKLMFYLYNFLHDSF